MIQAIDWSILEIIQRLRSPFLDSSLSRITLIGEDGILWIIIAVLMMFFPKTRKCGFAMGVCLILCLILGNVILKPLIARPRPYMLDEAIEIIVPLSDSFSFPSGHTYSSIGSAIVIWYYLKYKWGIPALCLAVIIAFSRMYLQMHFFTDILGGILLGTFAAVCGITFINFLYRKKRLSL